jgi:CheY-like chemotaxis protein
VTRWGIRLPKEWLQNRKLREWADMTGRRTSVLVVEDELLICKLITEVLCESGFAVHAVADAEEALRYLESGADIDVLFTDIDLPGGMDGSMLARQARVQRPELPVIYCSGRYSPSALAPPVPRSIFLRKPYSPAELCRLLVRLTVTH